ncbi:MAG: thioredoxin domain-containing protein, partial [Bacteroidetes bacterium]
MNRLQYETSPYLLQHKNNPVDWYAWKPEALERAKKENKPILVSIGYSTCHWCHVMERESFEDHSIAAYMNEHFINIKVDREERPDLDDIYMSACQIINGNGGWPLNAFLTPEGKPFYAGTYFPPEPKHGRPSWAQMLQFAVHNFFENRKAVDQQAERIMNRILQSDNALTTPIVKGPKSEKPFEDVDFESVFGMIKARFDTTHGGFGGAPKFPDLMQLQFLLNHYYHTGNNEAFNHLKLSLEAMSLGGIYDQLGGGLARYSTDKEWLAPHFEKMLYDNALFVEMLSKTIKAEPNQLFEETIIDTLEFVKREMTNPQGGFYAALDADSEGVEGKFYVWDKEEIDITLGKESELFCDFYDVSQQGNWEGVNILRRLHTKEAFALKHRLMESDLEEKLASGRKKLFDLRSHRIRPGRDEKMLLSWNALMCSAYAQAYSALGDESYKQAALKNIEFVLNHMQMETGHLYRTYSEVDGGKAQYLAYLEDYAFFIKALLDVYEIHFDLELLELADRFMKIILEEYYDPNDKLFYFTSSRQSDIVARKKAIYDSEKPSGNSVLVHDLQRLGLMIDNQDYVEKGLEMLLSMKEVVKKSPSPFANWATVMQNEYYGVNEIAIIGPEAGQQAK